MQAAPIPGRDYAGKGLDMVRASSPQIELIQISVETKIPPSNILEAVTTGENSITNVNPSSSTSRSRRLETAISAVCFYEFLKEEFWADARQSGYATLSSGLRSRLRAAKRRAAACRAQRSTIAT